MRNKRIAIPLFAAMIISFFGCTKSPETSVVQTKDMDAMIEKAESTEEGVNNYADVVDEVNSNAKTYKAEIEEEALGVKVSVDAKVVVPEASKLSVFRVSQKNISQEFLDKVREELAPGVTMYDGNLLYMRTKADVASEIKFYESNKAVVGENGILDQETADAHNEEMKQRISELELEYENAPDKFDDISSYVSDNTIHSVSEKYNSNPADEFYKWLYDLNADGEVYYGISDGLDGNYSSLTLYNSPNYGNCLRFQNSKNGYVFTTSFVLEDGITDQLALDREKPKPEDDLMEEDMIHVYENEEATISEREAKEQADSLMKNLGLTEYSYCEGGLCFENLEFRGKSIGAHSMEDEGWTYRKVYEFLYMRNIDGIFVDNRTHYKNEEGWQGDSYVKKIWSGEAVIVAVNDEGIVSFKYCSPLSIDETVVENAGIKSFDEIKDIFERMVVIENAVTGGTIFIEIDSVELVYARISEKDNFDAGILVPIWDFKGKKTDEYGSETEGSIMSINAIDGSVIDWYLGY